MMDNLQTELWSDTTVEISRDASREEIPPLPKIAGDYQVVSGKGGALAYLALQVLKSEDKDVVMRSIASAMSILLDDSFNYTGATAKPVPLTGLDVAREDTTAEETLLVTNFVDAEPVTVGELRTVMQFDTDELGAYFGVMFVAGNKRLTPQNRTAFNEKRAGAATAGVIGDPKIFRPESEFLTDTLVQKIYACFYSRAPLRAHMTDRGAARMGSVMMGAPASFASMFLLLSDSGLGWLKIIKEASIKHPWLRTDFPELRIELSAANKAQQSIRKAPAYQRPFLKAIFGNQFVPVTSGQVANLFGVAKEIMAVTVSTYRNFLGGVVHPHQHAVIAKHFGQAETTPDQSVETED